MTSARAATRIAFVGVCLALSLSMASDGRADPLICACQWMYALPTIVEGQGNCRPYETEICWAQTGPPGPPGPPGMTGPPGADSIGDGVRIDLRPDEPTQLDRTWFVPGGKLLLVDHMIWNRNWRNSADPMSVSLRAIFESGGPVEAPIESTSGFRAFDPPLSIPGNTGFEAPMIVNGNEYRLFIYGRMFDADSILATGTD